MCLVMFGPFAHDLRPSAVFDWFSPRLAEVLRTTVECAAAARGFTGRSPFKADGLHYSFIIVSVYRAWKWRLKIAGICRNMKLHETVIYVYGCIISKSSSYFCSVMLSWACPLDRTARKKKEVLATSEPFNEKHRNRTWDQCEWSQSEKNLKRLDGVSRLF